MTATNTSDKNWQRGFWSLILVQFQGAFSDNALKNLVLFLILGLGFFGGFFIVPVSALLQHRPSPRNKGGVLAAANLLSFVGIFLASGVYYLLVHLFGLNSSGIFLLSAAFTGVTALAIIWQRPGFLTEFFRSRFGNSSGAKHNVLPSINRLAGFNTKPKGPKRFNS